MSFLDKFKSKKEQEVKEKTAALTDKVKDSKKKVVKDAKKASKSKTKKEKEVVAKKSMSIPSGLVNVILRPHITEKSAVLASSGKYVFVVSIDSGSVQVGSAIRAMYGITPVSVNIQNVKGKRVRFGRIKGKRKNWKKAIVTLPKGKTIDVFEGV